MAAHEHVSAETGETMTHEHADPDNQHGYWERVYPEIASIVARAIVPKEGN